jgi:hypothetical protein
MKAITRLLNRLHALSPVYMGVLLFVLALLVRVAIIVHFRPYHDLTRYELERTAISLAQTGVYGNPYALPTGPTAHVSPGYTLILAALFHTFGTGTSAEIVKELLASCVTCLEIALLPALAVCLSLQKHAGFFAGLVMALYPARPMVEVDGDWEAPYMALALMLIAIMATHIWTKRDVRLSRAVLHGALWGICLLFVSALLPLFAAFVIFDSFWRRDQFTRRLAFAIVELAVTAACLAPWVIRNEIALGSPVVTRTNAGIELRISNNDSAVADQRVNAINGLFERYHPLQSRAEALKVRQLGEVEYNRRTMQEARKWIRDHPKRFLELTLDRIRLFWFFVDPTSRVKTAFLWLVSVLGLTGVIVALARSSMAGIILGAIALLYPIPNYLVHVTLRQSYPLEWLLLLLACALFTNPFSSARKDAPRMQTVGSTS